MALFKEIGVQIINQNCLVYERTGAEKNWKKVFSCPIQDKQKLINFLVNAPEHWHFVFYFDDFDRADDFLFALRVVAADKNC